MSISETNREKIFHYSIYLFSFALPFDHKFSNNLVILSAILWLFVSPKTDTSLYWKKFKWYILLFSSLFFINIPGLIHGDNVPAALSKLEMRYVYLVLPVIILLSNFNKNNARQACFGFCVGVVTSSLLCIVFNLIDYLQSDDIPLSHQFTYEQLLDPLNLHPNFYSIYVSFAVLIVIHEIAFHKQSKALRFGLAMLVLYLIVIDFLIQSRAPITAMFVVLFLGLGYWLIRFQHARSRTVTFIMLALIAFFALFATNEKIRGRFVISIHDVEDKIFKPDSELQASPQTRSTIFHLRCWYCAAGLLSDYHFFTGYGSGDEKDVLVECYQSHEWTTMVQQKLSAHNEYLSSLLRHGLPELILLLCSLLLPFIQSLRTNQALYTAFIVLWILILFFCALNRQSALSYYAFFNAIFFKIMQEPDDSLKSLREV